MENTEHVHEILQNFPIDCLNPLQQNTIAMQAYRVSHIQWTELTLYRTKRTSLFAVREFSGINNGVSSMCTNVYISQRRAEILSLHQYNVHNCTCTHSTNRINVAELEPIYIYR